MPLQVAGAMLVVIVVVGVRAHAELAVGSVLAWLFVAGFGTLVLGTPYARMERAATDAAAGRCRSVRFAFV